MTGALSPQSAQQVAGEVMFKADQIKANQRSGSGSLRLALRNLDGATVLQLQQWQQKLAGKPDDPQAMDELLEADESLAAGQTGIHARHSGQAERGRMAGPSWC
jgi:hypothetical protein